LILVTPKNRNLLPPELLFRPFFVYNTTEEERGHEWEKDSDRAYLRPKFRQNGDHSHGSRGHRGSCGWVDQYARDNPNTKTLICTVEEAVKLGADAVSIHVNLGNKEEKSMLRDLGVVSRVAMEWGMPLLAMMYSKTRKGEDEKDVKIVKHSARLGAELGADIVKVPYTGSPESFREVVEGCFVPVVIAGGGKIETDQDILEMVKGAINAGGAGVSIGRNVFQHKNPSKMVRAICKIVHHGSTVKEGLKELGQRG
jgi:DhnA family fructose-bisphosphate aldolase class Ia